MSRFTVEITQLIFGCVLFLVGLIALFVNRNEIFAETIIASYIVLPSFAITYGVILMWFSYSFLKIGNYKG